MTTYLLTWNPARWAWDDLKNSIRTFNKQGHLSRTWSTGVTKKIHSDDRVFLIKLGEGKRGLIASGWATSEVYEDLHWDNPAKSALYIDIDLDTLLDPDENIFPREWLDSGIYTKMRWEPQASGVTIPDDVALKLEKDWARFLDKPTVIEEAKLPEESEADQTCREGTTRKIIVNAYERSSKARNICLNHYGAICSVCNFSFTEKYGVIGQGFIHVHHLKPLSEIQRGYTLNPKRDLRPVCPNCHAMLHRRIPAYSIDELKAIINKHKR
jgi:5-methylcytosine-specific restriction enzyme A